MGSISHVSLAKEMRCHKGNQYVGCPFSPPMVICWIWKYVPQRSRVTLLETNIHSQGTWTMIFLFPKMGYVTLPGTYFSQKERQENRSGSLKTTSSTVQPYPLPFFSQRLENKCDQWCVSGVWPNRLRCEDLKPISVGLHLNSRHLLFLGSAAIMGGGGYVNPSWEKKHQNGVGKYGRSEDLRRLRCIFGSCHCGKWPLVAVCSLVVCHLAAVSWKKKHIPKFAEF